MGHFWANRWHFRYLFNSLEHIKNRLAIVVFIHVLRVLHGRRCNMLNRVFVFIKVFKSDLDRLRNIEILITNFIWRWWTNKDLGVIFFVFGITERSCVCTIGWWFWVVLLNHGVKLRVLKSRYLASLDCGRISNVFVQGLQIFSFLEHIPIHNCLVGCHLKGLGYLLSWTSSW